MKTKKRIISMVAIMCAAFMVTGCKSKTQDYEKPVQTLCEAKQDGDLEKFLTLFGPLKSMMSSVVTEDVFKEKLNTYKSTCGEDYKLSYKLTKEEKMDEDGLKEAEDNLSILGQEVKITEGYKLEVEVTAKGDKDTVKKTMNLSVGKIDNEWCIVNFDKTLLE